MNIKVAGYALVWFGVIGLLKGIGVIRIVDWSIIWPVLVIVLGLSLKHYKHSLTCAVGGNCDSCGKGNHNTCGCGGSGCDTCKVK